jgi:DNA-binding transcriptional ArsR family regulator
VERKARYYKLIKMYQYVGTAPGEGYYEMIRNRLLSTPDGCPLVISFPDERPLDASFADACLIRLGGELLAGGYGERGLLLHNLTKDSVFNLEAAIALRDVSLAFLLVSPDGRWKALGRLAPNMRETLKLVAERKSLPVSSLKKGRKLEPNAASNRLKRLYDMRLVWREPVLMGRGVAYTYHSWQWSG